MQDGLNDVQIEIEGSPKFHALHWEALKDPELPEPLVLQATMVRKNLVPSVDTVAGAPVTYHQPAHRHCSPSGKRDVGYRTISRPLVEALRQTSVPIQIDILRPGTYQSTGEPPERHQRRNTARAIITSSTSTCMAPS